MPYCPRCGSEVKPDDKFCSRCGSSLSTAPARAPTEKDEKGEKREKEEKYEKREMNALFQLAFGLILIIVGVLVFITAFNFFSFRLAWAYFLLAVGIVIIVFAIASARTALKRNPKP
ncbi:zinc-ribbon domain-containing protein [Candidatus Bathyarchaeota archaeon]|nr:zinc-ribbon domain-containing protein [Candidatus Bathyarchaeota archaeon]